MIGAIMLLSKLEWSGGVILQKMFSHSVVNSGAY